MQYVFPDYYKDFRCIAGKCRHSCCIGWEIDIDPDTAEYYGTVQGDTGDRLRKSISQEGDAHFILGEGERCPFLNGDNLCDIILALGEDALCDICTEHPRFYNEYPGRVETGIGICCEEAARLILGRKEPMRLEVSGDADSENKILQKRDRIISLLQNRKKTVNERVEEMLALASAHVQYKSMTEWAEFFLSLERLDDEWTRVLEFLQKKWKNADLSAFDKYMGVRQTEYEQLLVYFAYRHFANSRNETEMSQYMGFAVLSYMLLRHIGAAVFAESGEFTFYQQAELARLFSSEIEYSDENMEIVLNEIRIGRF